MVTSFMPLNLEAKPRGATNHQDWRIALSSFVIATDMDVERSGSGVERSGSGVELRTLDYENPGTNPGCGVKTLGKFFHSTLLQFTQLNK